MDLCCPLHPCPLNPCPSTIADPRASGNSGDYMFLIRSPGVFLVAMFYFLGTFRLSASIPPGPGCALDFGFQKNVK